MTFRQLMRLDNARLCLDCEEIHEEQVCPTCGSEAFGFLTRWIKAKRDPADTSSQPPRPLPGRHRVETTVSRPPPTVEQVEAWRRIVEGAPAASPGRVVARSLLGLTAMGLAGWAWSKKKSTDD